MVLSALYGACWLFSLGIAASILRQLRAKAHLFSTKCYAMHLQLTTLLYIQVLSPAAVLFVPAALILLAKFDFAFGLGVYQHVYCSLIFACWAPGNALVTLYFVRPYRRYTMRLLRAYVSELSPLGAGLLQTSLPPTSPYPGVPVHELHCHQLH
jgi:Serpentine type 7TM GPCR chemoreceptor Str